VAQKRVSQRADAVSFHLRTSAFVHFSPLPRRHSVEHRSCGTRNGEEAQMQGVLGTPVTGRRSRRRKPRRVAKPHLAGSSCSGGRWSRGEEPRTQARSPSNQISPGSKPKLWVSNWREAIGAGCGRSSTARIGVEEQRQSRGGGGGERIKGRRRTAQGWKQGGTEQKLVDFPESGRHRLAGPTFQVQRTH
jgi:hypothetical protein